MRPPGIPGFEAFLALWPTRLSYAVSDLFIAIVWVNHRYPVRYAADATPRLLCFNFVRSGCDCRAEVPAGRARNLHCLPRSLSSARSAGSHDEKSVAGKAVARRLEKRTFQVF
jgi:hypothetical protein